MYSEIQMYSLIIDKRNAQGRWGQESGVGRPWGHLPPWTHKTRTTYREILPENELKTSWMALLQPSLKRKNHTESGRREEVI